MFHIRISNVYELLDSGAASIPSKGVWAPGTMGPLVAMGGWAGPRQGTSLLTSTANQGLSFNNIAVIFILF